jgi:hypothetical protein
VSFSMENIVVSDISQDLVLIFKIKQSTVRNNLPSDKVTPCKSGTFKTPFAYLLTYSMEQSPS